MIVPVTMIRTMRRKTTTHPTNNIINKNAADNNTNAVNVANGTQDHDAGGKPVALTIACDAPNNNNTHEAHVDTPFEHYDNAAEA